MNDISARLTKCFQTVFPDLPETSISTARQDSVPAWDSVATIMLVNVVEDEFRIQMDLERLPEFSSFDAISAYVADTVH
jgi:acyl carrier protein